MLQELASRNRIDLARQPGFALGDLRVEPARLTLRRGRESLAIEPRMMAVLIVLAEADGRVVSRDELVDRCWDGRIVADNAIQRVVSRLRHVAATLGGFEIETITKVGYLVRPVAATASITGDAEPAAQATITGKSRGPDRRTLLGGALLLAVSGAGLLAQREWKPSSGARPSGATARTASARQLVAKAREMELMGGRDANAQAIAYLTRATEIDPALAAAWGMLALAYSARMDQSEGSELPALADEVRGAAERALALAPGQSAASLALATIRPNFRNWAANEQALRALAVGHPSNEALECALGWLLCDVGRWREAIACFRRGLASEPFHPGHQMILAWGLWGAGSTGEAERILDGAHRLWPYHRSIWQTRFDFFALTGKPEAAIAMLDDEGAQPVVERDHFPVPYAGLRKVAEAIASGSRADAERAGQTAVEIRGAIGTYSAVAYLAALGLPDEAFAMLDGYFFGDDTRPPPTPLSRRKTSILFSAKGAPLRADPRWAGLVQRTGLASYWRETGTRADHGLGSRVPA